VGDEVHAPSSDVGRLPKPFGVDRCVETLDVVPSGLVIIRLIGVVAVCDTGDVILPKKSLECLSDGGLRFALR
jgi:hypothetical protein